MVLMLWLAVFLHVKDTTHAYPLYLHGNFSAVQTFLKIINSELPANASVLATSTNPTLKEYGISFLVENDTLQLADRKGRFLCGIKRLLNDSLKTFHVRLVSNSSGVLIGDGQNATIDVTDIEKFNTAQSSNFTAGNVLLHELYEQYYIQVVGKFRPGRVTAIGLRRAHERAIQKESLIFDLIMLKTSTEVVDNHYIRIEFTNRFDLSKIWYYAYYDRGNIERVEMSNPANILN